MAGANEAVEALIRRWPCAYMNRTQALHQILVVLGSGYRWQENEAVYWADDPRTCLDFHRDWAERAEGWRARGLTVPDEDLDPTCPAEERRARAKELSQLAGPLGQDPYPPCDIALLATLPTAASEDWRAAAREIADVVTPLWTSGQGMEPGQVEQLAPVLRRLAELGLV